MILKPIFSERALSVLAHAILFITAPLWAIPAGLLIVGVWITTKVATALRPGREWEPWFAWRPVTLSIWTGDDDFTGTVWLETIYRRYRPMCGIELRRGRVASPPRDKEG